MRMLIVYDRTRCTHQGFGAQNWLQIVISFDFHSPFNVSPELGLVSGLCSDHKHLWTVYIVFNVQISFTRTAFTRCSAICHSISGGGYFFKKPFQNMHWCVHVCVSLHLCLGPAGDSGDTG